MEKFTKTGLVLAVLMFFSQADAIWAQQEEFFINPERNPAGVTINHRANFSRYDVSWGVVSVQHGVIISFRNMVAPQNVRERFITSHEQLSFIDARAGGYNDITITWDGRWPDGQVHPGQYFIIINHTLTSNRQHISERRIPVTIITRDLNFEIAFGLGSNLINRRAGQRVFFTISPEVAYSWRVIIKRPDGTNIVNRVVSSGHDVFFPGFVLSEAENAVLDLYMPYMIIVEATDRAGIRFSSSASFQIIDAPVVTARPIADHGEIAGMRRKLEIMALEIADIRRELENRDFEIANMREERERTRREFAAGWINLANRTIDFSYRLMGETREREIVNMIETLE